MIYICTNIYEQIKSLNIGEVLR